MMILGQNEKTAFSILTTVWLSICTHASSKYAEFFIADFSRAGDIWATLLPKLHEIFPHTATLARQRDFGNLVSQVNNILDQRIDNSDLAERRIFFILAGLHRARELRDTDQYGSLGETAQIFGKICREGPDLGIHVISWCDTFGNLARLVDRRTISEFDLRIAMKMGEDDSNQFIESPKAKALGQNRAYLFDQNQIGKIEKFRPYELISESELEEIQTSFGDKE
ncbi:MAG: hypothetical protein H8D23_13630 [Candidatus Brocadiales bacterium]|nr:hypothetical protein [Candidatus Brocadiales bacterium]